MNEVRWGIVGCGDVCEVKSGPGFQKAEGSRLVAVMRRDAARAEDYARRHGVGRWTTSAAELIGDPEVDAVYVATPPDSHAAYTAMAAAAGKPVYVEKPMARTAAECAAMLDVCRRAGVPLFVAYYRRRLPRFVHVRRLLEEGAIGEVRVVTLTHLRPAGKSDGPLPWRLVPEVSGGGFFHDVGCHALDLLDHLLGPIAEARGWGRNLGRNYAADDTVTATWRFENGAQGVGTWCFCADQACDRVEIVGSRGMLSFAVFADVPITLTRRDAAPEQVAIPNPPHVQQPLIQTIVDQLRGKGVCPSTGESARRTAVVMDAILGRTPGN